MSYIYNRAYYDVFYAEKYTYYQYTRIISGSNCGLLFKRDTIDYASVK